MKARIALCVALWLASACAGTAAHPVDTTDALEAVDLSAHYNPAVTQANVDQTVCVPGWTATIRPPLSYTNPIKRALWIQAGRKGKLTDFELDHVVPLGSGGAPYSRANLALQPWDGPDGAHAKDVVETRVQREVCAHKITLATARRCFVVDWRKCPQ